MNDYQPFAISNFRTGLNESVEPWLLPRDAFQQMINARQYRGVVQKALGYTLFAPFSVRRITYFDQAPDGVRTNFTVTLPFDMISTNFIIYGTIIAGTSAAIGTYSSEVGNVITATGTGITSATINLTTLVVSVTFTTPPPALASYGTAFIMWDAAPASATAIMGIKPFFNSSGGQEILVFDQKRVGTIETNLGTLAATLEANQIVQEIPHDYYQTAIITGNGTPGPYTNPPALQAPFVPGTLKFFEYTIATGAPTGRVWTDNGVGGITGDGLSAGLVNYTTGAFTVTFTGNLANTLAISSTVGVYGDLFTGSISDFFSLVNYQYKAFFCNNVDHIFYYDGTTIKYLPTNLTVRVINSTSGVPNYATTTGYSISKCLHVFVDRERLLLISPTVDAVNVVNGIYWSTAGEPLNFTNDEKLLASTSQPIRTFGYINSDLVVRFADSERVFRYTGDAFSPFRWDSTNNVWACDAPYGAINYDSWFSSVGKPAIVGSDAVNVRRADELIPDFTTPTRLALQVPMPYINQNSIQQCYGERFDDIKEGWLCYNSAPIGQTSVTASDNVLAFSYLDQTYSVYQFPFSCLGFGRIVNVQTWSTNFTEWEAAANTWDSYQATQNSLTDLAGDQFDKVYQLNTGNSMGDNDTPVLMSVITKNFNPFIESGQLCRLGYVDIFVSASSQSTLRVQFYVNDQLYIDSNDEPAGYYQETTLTFTPTDSMSPNTPQTKVWKRIYCGAVGKEHTLRFYQNADDFTQTLDQPIYIHAIVLYMKPAGILFN